MPEKQITVNIPVQKEDKERLQALAASEFRTPTSLARWLLVTSLDTYERTNKPLRTKDEEPYHIWLDEAEADDLATKGYLLHASV